MRKNLNLGKRNDKIVLWREITRALKDLYTLNKNVNNADEIKSNSTQNKFNSKVWESENKLNPEGPSCVLPAPSKETCICARDMSVGEVICGHLP